MKIREILNLLSVLIILFCISPIFEIIIHFNDVLEDFNGYLTLIILVASLLLCLLTLILVHLEKILFLQITLPIIIFGLNLGTLIYFTIYFRDFWISQLTRLIAFKLASIISIFCSIPIILLSYFQYISKKNMNIKSSIEELKNKIKLIYLQLGTLVSYFPIIAGILYSMTVMPALAYLSWHIFNIWPGIDFMAAWIFHKGYPTNFPIYLLLWIEIITFIFGFGFFLLGVIHLVKGKKRKIEIVQTGVYKYIRHPQNLGIIIFSFPFCLYVPFLGDSGLKIGDIFSWMLFCVLTIIYSDIEEIQMLKRYPDEYKIYRSNTGFFFPRIIKNKNQIINLDIKNYFFRWIILIGGYILLISTLTFIFSNFPLLYLRYIS
jgi:protein-S-isoprenylcysteine O-methyltransferase Ste14